jgi:hypothetical protein
MNLPKKYIKIRNIGLTEIELVLFGEGSWRHYMLAPNNTIEVPLGYGSSILEEFVRRKQVSIKEVVK